MATTTRRHVRFLLVIVFTIVATWLARPPVAARSDGDLDTRIRNSSRRNVASGRT